MFLQQNLCRTQRKKSVRWDQVSKGLTYPLSKLLRVEWLTGGEGVESFEMKNEA
jgi:hypothetical protein